MDSTPIDRGPGAATAARATTTGPTAGGKALPAAGNYPPAPAPSPAEAMRTAVAQIQRYISSNHRDLQFELDDGSGRTVIRVINPETQEVVRQIPSEEALRLSAAMTAHLGGLLDENA